MSTAPQHPGGRGIPGDLGEVLLHNDFPDTVHPLLPLHPPPLRPGPRDGHIDVIHCCGAITSLRI